MSGNLGEGPLPHTRSHGLVGLVTSRQFQVEKGGIWEQEVARLRQGNRG
jgi:hypothetical protein